MLQHDCAMGFRALVLAIRITVVKLLCLACFFPPGLFADIEFEGGVSPENPESWHEDTVGYVGFGGEYGVISIYGDYLAARETYVGYQSPGILRVMGAGSAFQSDVLYVGWGAEGSVFASDGARIYTGPTYVGAGGLGQVVIESSSALEADHLVIGGTSLGYVTVDSSRLFARRLDLTGGILNLVSPESVEIGSFYGRLDFLSGNGTILAFGIVTDMDLVFESTEQLFQSFPFGQGGNFELDLRYDAGDLGVGYSYGGSGSLKINGNVTVPTLDAYLGYLPGSQGTAIVTGSGAKWDVFSQLRIGYFGQGDLTIKDGGEVSAWITYVATGKGSQGTIIVRGPGSTLNTEWDLYLGGQGANVIVRDGGQVIAKRAILPQGATLDLEVGHQPVLVLTDRPFLGDLVWPGTLNHNGTIILRAGEGLPLWPGTLSHNGTIILRAGEGLPPGIYRPIVAQVWNDESGRYEAHGGVWDRTRHVFAVGHASNQAIQVDLSRPTTVPIYDQGTMAYLILEFPGGEEGSATLSATPATGAVLQALEATAGGQLVAGAWLFNFDQPISFAWLSFLVGPGYSPNLFRFWRYDGNRWDPFVPEESSYDNAYVRFKIPGFSGYGVSIVPEPNVLTLLASLGTGLAGYWWLRSRRRLKSQTPT
jgi:T5SS/PEP-CTERM-associated repeat protein